MATDQHGTWRIRGRSRRAHPGYLTQESGRTILTIFAPDELDVGVTLPMINGVGVDGQPISLIDSTCVAAVPSPGGPRVLQLRPTYVFKGIELKVKPRPRFSVVAIEPQALKLWFGNRQFLLGCRPPDDYAVEVPVGPAVIRFSCAWRRSAKTFETRFRQHATAEVKAPAPMTLLQLEATYLRPLCAFLSVSTGRPTSYEAVHLFGDTNTPIEVTGWGRPGVEHDLRFDEMPMSFADVESRLPAILSRWFEIHGRIGDLIDILVGLDSEQVHVLERQFLATVSIVEGLHRRLDPVPADKIRRYRLRLKRDLRMVPAKRRKSLARRLKYGYEPNLESRIRSVMTTAGNVVEPFIKDEDLFLRRVAQTRNSIAHSKRLTDAGAIPLERMWEYTFVLKRVARAFVFAHLLPDDPNAPMRAAVDNAYHFQKARIRLP